VWWREQTPRVRAVAAVAAATAAVHHRPPLPRAHLLHDFVDGGVEALHLAHGEGLGRGVDLLLHDLLLHVWAGGGGQGGRGSDTELVLRWTEGVRTLGSRQGSGVRGALRARAPRTVARGAKPAAARTAAAAGFGRAAAAQAERRPAGRGAQAG
jgi:hypothetical protein